MLCAFDEDCPEGSVCACVPGEDGSVASVCLGVSDRTSTDARSAWAKCYAPPADAGADAASD